MEKVRTRLRCELETRGIGFRVISHEPVLTMEDVKRVLRVELEETAKTLVVKAGGRMFLVVVPGNHRLDKKKLARLLEVSRKSIDMLPREEVIKETHLEPGAIPPFGLGLPVVIDLSLLAKHWIYCGFASHVESLQINPKDLQVVSQAIVGDISV